MDALKFPAEELSPWVSTSTPPLRTGVFKVADTCSLNGPWYSFWDGRWHGAWTSPDEAFDHRDFPTAGSVGYWWAWRGLAQNPLAEIASASITLPEIFLAVPAH